jgi:hypothetical protein
MIMVSTDTELARGLLPSRKPQGCSFHEKFVVMWIVCHINTHHEDVYSSFKRVNLHHCNLGVVSYSLLRMNLIRMIRPG